MRRKLGTQTQPRLSSHDIICVHTMVGYLKSTYGMFEQNGFSGVESHFGIGGKWGSDANDGLDGVTWQFQDTDFTADANLEGNHRVLSIETADNAPRLAKDILPWTPKQLDEIVRLIAELCKMYNIPAKLIPDTKPGRRGLAYHAQGISPNLVSGGEKWSSAPGKECPGPVRIRQFKEIVIPRVQAKLAGKTIKAQEEEVSQDSKVKLSAAMAAALNKIDGDKHKEGSEVSLGHILTVLAQSVSKETK
jgi:hypothetical protein